MVHNEEAIANQRENQTSGSYQVSAQMPRCPVPRHGNHDSSWKKGQGMISWRRLSEDDLLSWPLLSGISTALAAMVDKFFVVIKRGVEENGSRRG